MAGNRNKEEMEAILSKKYLLSVKECLDIQSYYSEKKDDKDDNDNDNDNDNVVFLDGSWFLGTDRNGRAEYEAGPRIQGARYFDIDDISSKAGSHLNPKDLPHMRPSKKLFAAAMSALKIQNSDHVIVYGGDTCMFIHRAAYIIQNMGHDISKVHIMEGSLKEWIELGGPVDTDPIKALTVADLNINEDDADGNGNGNGENTYTANEASQFCDFVEVKEAIEKGMDGVTNAIVLDARGAARFNAKAPEPRPGLRSGHMPGSINVPFPNVLEPDTFLKLKSPSELRQAFEDVGVNVDDTDTKLYLSCGSGVTACILATALQECGRDPASTFVYDGSWVEWGGDPDTPINTKE